MYYRLPENIALRKWSDTDYTYCKKGTRYAIPLTAEQAQIMLLCDGEHDIETDDNVMNLIFKNMIMPCEKGEKNSKWSSLIEYYNRYFPGINFMITGKCNYNCLHCFNAADNSALNTEWTFEDICDLLDQAHDCGTVGVQLTGGEPMLHKNFLDIVREIYKRDMFVIKILTNGYFIT